MNPLLVKCNFFPTLYTGLQRCRQSTVYRYNLLCRLSNGINGPKRMHLKALSPRSCPNWVFPINSFVSFLEESLSHTNVTANFLVFSIIVFFNANGFLIRRSANCCQVQPAACFLSQVLLEHSYIYRLRIVDGCFRPTVAKLSICEINCMA